LVYRFRLSQKARDIPVFCPGKARASKLFRFWQIFLKAQDFPKSTCYLVIWKSWARISSSSLKLALFVYVSNKSTCFSKTTKNTYSDVYVFCVNRSSVVANGSLKSFKQGGGLDFKIVQICKNLSGGRKVSFSRNISN
jgi:hypothetical protein